MEKDGETKTWKEALRATLAQIQVPLFYEHYNTSQLKTFTEKYLIDYRIALKEQ